MGGWNEKMDMIQPSFKKSKQFMLNIDGKIIHFGRTFDNKQECVMEKFNKTDNPRYWTKKILEKSRGFRL